MSNEANGAKQLIKLLETSNEVITYLKTITENDPTLNSILHNASINKNDIKKLTKMIEEDLGAKDLLILVRKIKNLLP
jgi:uncharacterized protein YpiB (UPF0302 family)